VGVFAIIWASGIPDQRTTKAEGATMCNIVVSTGL